MPKGVERQEQQTGMQKTMLELEAKNSAMGRRLFATFGRDNSRALIFPTPARLELKDEEKEELKLVADFLVVTSDAYKAIHTDNNNRKEEDIGADGFSEEITNRLNKKEGILSFSTDGYKDGELRLGQISITSTNLQVFQVHPWGLRYSPEAFANWILMDASDFKVKKILELNLKRVEHERAVSQRISDVLSKVS